MRTRRRHRRAGVGVRHGAATRCSPTAGWSWRAGATASTGWPCAGPDGALTDSTCRSPRSAPCVAAGPTPSSCVAGSPTAEPGVHRRRAGRRGPTPADRRRIPAAARATWASTPATVSVPELVRFPSVDGADAPRPATPCSTRRPTRASRPGRRAAAAAGRHPRRPDRPGRAGARRRRAVLDQPRLRRGRRRLRRLAGYGRAYRELLDGAVGRRRRRRLRRRRPLAGRARRRRPGAAGDPRRLGRRLHHAGRAGPRRHPVRGRRRPLRRGRPRGAGPRHPQVRDPLPRRAGRARTRRRATCTSSARRSTTSTASRAR